MHIQKAKYLHDMALELAAMAESEGLDTLAYLFRMAEIEAKELIENDGPKGGQTNQGGPKIAAG